MTVVLSPLTEAHLEQVFAIEQAVLSSRASNLEYYRQYLQSNYYSCYIEENNSLVGYAILLCAAMEADVVMVAVKPEFQGKGYGRMLFENICEYAKANGVEELFLEVSQSNQTAINLYKSSGFEMIGNRKNYYTTANGREDALLMKKNYEVSGL